MITISDVSVTPASASERETGLLAYVSLVINNEMVLDGVTYRRTSNGRTTVSFPERRDGRGRRHPMIRPLNAESRARFELQVKDAIREQGIFL